MRNRLNLSPLDSIEDNSTNCAMSDSKMKDVTQEIVADYLSSLKDLITNNKAQINCLTILAEDYIDHAPAIVRAVEDHLQKVPSDIKLPVLYLIDSIVKNVNKAYLSLFTKSIVATFVSVFEKVDEHTRSCMWKLRQTWNEVFPVRKLYALDVGVHAIDPAWPIVAMPTSSSSSKSIQQLSAGKHKPSSKRVPSPPKRTPTPPKRIPTPPKDNAAAPSKPSSKPPSKPLTKEEAAMRDKLYKKRQQLIELQKKKVELELLQVKADLEQQRQEMSNLPAEDILDNSTPVFPSSQVATPVAIKNATPLPKIQSNKSSVKIAPASSIAVASAKIISRDPRLKVSANSEDQITQQHKLHIQSKLSDDHSSLSNDATKKKSESELTNTDNKSLDNKRAKESSHKKESVTSVTSTTGTTTTSQRSNSTNKDRSKSSSRVSSSSSKCSSSSSKSSSSSSKSSSSSSRKPGEKTRPKSSSSSPNKVPKLDENSPSSKRSSSDSSSSSSSSKKSKSRHSSHSSSSPSPPPGIPASVSSYRIPRRAPAQESLAASATSPTSDKSPTRDEEQKSSPSIVAPRLPASTTAPSATSFKEIRSNTKLRNYVRKNKEGSLSPPVSQDNKATTDANLPVASKDEDLRPPIVNITAGAAINKKDLDLRVLAVPTKRRSPDALETSSAKKSRAEKFDALFGNEDVDLRTLTNPTAGRPQTPPPPMISSADSKKNNGWATLKKSPVKIERETPKPVDRNRDRLGRSRIHKSGANPEGANDRLPRGPSTSRDCDRHNDRNIEIIMKDAAEQLDAGIITKTQYNTLIQDVLHMSEDQKLRAAQKKEALESSMTVWERNGSPPGFPSDDSQGRKPEHPGMHPRAAGASGPRWQTPWHQPWAHPPPPFPGGPPHGFPDGFRPMGPWTGPPPRIYGGPMRPDFPPPFFNPRMGPPPPMGPNGPMMMPNGPMGPAGPMNSMRPGGPIGPMPPTMMMNGPIRPQETPNKRSSPNSIAAAGPAIPTVPVSSAKPEAEKEVAAFKTMVNSAELPPADPKIIEEVSKDTMRSINIDGVPREIRYYGNIGVIFMHWDDPRDISFKNDTRRIIIDGKDTLLCSFNEDYREFTYNGEIHRIKLGTPTRELYVDDRWYQCYFGGQPITVDLGNNKISIKLEGPPPEVQYGTIKRTDLVLGKINLIINARNMVPVFLDAKPQVFEIEGRQCTLQFTDALQTVLLNGRPFKVEFGGLPKPIVVQGKKHFIRFSVLPRGFRAGHVRITGMAGEQPKEVDPLPTEVQNPEALVPSLTKVMPPTTIAPITAVNSSVLPGLDLNFAPQPVTTTAAASKPVSSLDILSSVMPSAIAPPSGLSYQAEPAVNPAPAVTLPLNLDELFQKLVDTGIIPGLTEVKKQEEEKKPEVPLATFEKPETLKPKPTTTIAALYNGMQCSSCGERFSSDMAARYSQHLDWHFRQNRKDKDATKKPQSRSWFFGMSDWVQYDDNDDVDNRAQSWFETEKQAETDGTSGDESQAEQLSVPTGSDEDSFCPTCQEQFEQFYNEEKEEWHMRPAISFDGKNYHPVCLEDHKRSLERSAMVLEETIAEMEEESKTEDNIDDSLTEMDEDKKDVKPENIKTEVKEEKGDTSAKDKEIGSAVKKEKEEEEKEKKENEEKEEEKTPEESVPEQSAPEQSAEASKDNKQPMEVDDSEPIEIIEPLPRKIELEEIHDSSDEEEADDSAKERPRRERRREEKVPDDIPLIFENVKVKEEPIDIDEEPEESIAEAAAVDTTQVEVKSTIDGNVELQSAAPTIPAAPSKIKINITKALPVVSRDSDESKNKKKPAESPVETAPAKPLIPAAIKPSLQGKKLRILPTVERGHELSGLCSIM